LSLRKFIRLIGALALAYPAATCTDATAPRGHGVAVPVVPTFSRTATFAKAVYSLAGLEYDRVRVLITRGTTEVLKDTTVDYSPASPDLTLPLTLAADPGEVVTATLEYRNATMVLYSGTVTVTTVAIGTPGATPTQLVVIPVGPGAEAATVQLSPSGGNFPVTDPVAFTAQARTSDGTVIPGALFAWTVDDETIATVGSDGVVHPTSKGGTVHVRATTLNEVFGDVAITFVTGPASLAIQSGNNQSAMAFEALSAPVVVKVLDANGLAVPGATVSFAVATGGGSLSAVNGTSDANGLVSASWTLGGLVGTQSITATATALPNAPLTVNATATERPAASLAFGQQPTNSLMGAQLMPAVTVKALDDHGRVVTGFTGSISIAFDANPGSATLGGTLSRNAVAGVATFNDLTVSAAGTGYTLAASSTGLATVASDAFDVEQVPAGLSLFAGGSQNANIRATLSPIVVKVADANGNGAPGVAVNFAVATGGGSVDVATAVTDANGLAQTTWTLGNTVGTQSITATSGTLAGSPLTITAEATPLPAIGIAFVQQPTTAAVNATISPAVTVRAVDSDGGTVTGFAGIITVTFDQNPGNGTLSGTTSVAAVNGVATFADLSINAVGTGYELKASATALPAVSSSEFDVTPGAPAALAFVVQPSSAIAGSVITPAITVKVVDAFGNTVTTASTQVTIGFNGIIDALLAGTKTVNAVNGVATFSDIAISPTLGGIKLKATASGLTAAISTSFDILPVPGVTLQWTGANSSNWDDPGNWSPAAVPAPQDTVTIPSSLNSPVITGNSYAKLVTVENGGALRIDNATGTFLNTDSITNKGTLTLTYALLSAVIRNAGTVIVDSIGSSTSFINESGATTRLIGSNGNTAILTVPQGFDNAGLLELTDANGGSAGISVGDSLVNRAGATINVLQGGGGGSRVIIAVLRNHGALNSSSTTGLTMEHFVDGSTSTNDGSITVTAGDFYQIFGDPTATFTNTGAISLGGSLWSVTTGNMVLRAGTMTGTGLFQAYGTTLDIDFSKFPWAMNLDLNSRLAGTTFDVPSGQVATLTGSTITQQVTVSGTLRVIDTLSYDVVMFQGGADINDNGLIETRGDVQMNGAFSIAKTGKLRLISDGGFKRTFWSPKPFVNDGQIDMTSSADGQTVLQVQGLLTNSATGTISALGGGGGERRIEAQVDNKGTVFVAQDGYLTLQSPGANITNSGTITLEDAPGPKDPGLPNTNSLVVNPFGGTGTNLVSTGTISVGANRTLQVPAPSVLWNQGLTVGNGRIQVPSGALFINDGTIDPGRQGVVGTLTIDGDFDIGKGTVEIDVASIDGSTTVGDLLSVTGSAAVTGIVKVVPAVEFFYGPNGGSHVAITAPKGCQGTPVIQPVNVWDGYNDGCVHVYPIIIGTSLQPAAGYALSGELLSGKQR
jgi:hypothetical protein